MTEGKGVKEVREGSEAREGSEEKGEKEASKVKSSKDKHLNIFTIPVC